MAEVLLSLLLEACGWRMMMPNEEEQLRNDHHSQSGTSSEVLIQHVHAPQTILRIKFISTHNNNTDNNYTRMIEIDGVPRSLRDTALFLSGMVVLRCANAPYTEMSGTPAEVKMEMPPRVVVAAPPAVSEMATSLGTRTIHTTTSTQGADAVAETRTITPPRRRGRKRLRPLTPPMQELLLSQDEVVTSTQLLVPTSSPTQCLVPAESATPPSTLEMQPVAIKTTSEPADVASGVPPAIVAAMDELSPSSQDDALDLSPSATTSAEDAGEASATSTTPLAMMVAAPTVRRGRSRMGEAERGEQHYATMKYTGHGLVPLEEIRACQGGGGGDALHHTSASYLHVVRQTCKRLATTTTTTTTTTTRPRTWLHTALHQIDDVWRGASSVRGGMLHGLQLTVAGGQLTGDAQQAACAALQRDEMEARRYYGTHNYNNKRNHVDDDDEDALTGVIPKEEEEVCSFPRRRPRMCVPVSGAALYHAQIRTSNEDDNDDDGATNKKFWRCGPPLHGIPSAPTMAIANTYSIRGTFALLPQTCGAPLVVENTSSDLYRSVFLRVLPKDLRERVDDDRRYVYVNELSPRRSAALVEEVEDGEMNMDRAVRNVDIAPLSMPDVEWSYGQW